MIPDARILTFGYDADVDGFLSLAGQNTIHQHAQSLLSDLADFRSSPAEVRHPERSLLILLTIVADVTGRLFFEISMSSCMCAAWPVPSCILFITQETHG